MSLKKEILIRPPKYNEKEEFYRVYNTGLPGVDETTPKNFAKWWNRCSESGEMDRLWRVAVVDDTIIGVIINMVNVELNWGFVWELAVLPEFRDQGIGTLLILESEKLLLKHHPEIDDLAIGVKTNNIKALELYEKLGYGIRFLELHLEGKRWASDQKHNLKVEPASEDRIEELMKLSPDAYWGTKDVDGWKEIIKPEHRIFTTENNQLVGFVRLFVDEERSSCSEVQFNIKPGYGSQVIEACMEFIETDSIDLWVQDDHQDIIDMLNRREFKRIDSEFLLRKAVPKSM
ncbi:GNAT family N-acetyltransferase [Candidatus Thorarchaeota archaeon]|nr:GNAT family N-acetyltransferase [Candidatus Thorarchaeota archaeon]TFG95301.1 MAG: GNAT family N-acetyltransferase [Candidatus Thorarchaeota archaeon]